ncbi:MAG: hypothetical protein EOM24_33720 [Chloroflexia bacterium]|nr:hypothetical protein [Chloroflexia bacterium]
MSLTALQLELNLTRQHFKRIERELLSAWNSLSAIEAQIRMEQMRATHLCERFKNLQTEERDVEVIDGD